MLAVVSDTSIVVAALRSRTDDELDAVTGGAPHPVQQDCGPLFNAWEAWIADYFGICVR